MPWINLTMRRGALTKEMQHAVMAKLTDTLMFWEKIPDTPEARKKMKGWVQGPFRIDPIYDEEKVVFLRPDIAETYAPVKITVAYGGQNPAPRPFIMVLLWIKTPEGWRMATDIPIPVPPDPRPR